MATFQASKTKTSQLKWIIYILIGLSLLIYINVYSNWNLFFKFFWSLILLINLVFDFFYLIKARSIITELEFDKHQIIIKYKRGRNKKIKYSNINYSIRKRKFDKHKTEIELKEKKILKFKTFNRIHIKNWQDTFVIEKELEAHKIKRVEWKPQTLWSKYWGIFIDIFFFSIIQDEPGLTEYQNNSIRETTENSIKTKNNK